jgi:hypothetical protein
LSQLAVHLVDAVAHVGHITFHVAQFIETSVELCVAHGRVLIQTRPRDQPLDRTPTGARRINDIHPDRVVARSHLRGQRRHERRDVQAPALIAAVATHGDRGLEDVDPPVQHSTQIGQPGLLVIHEQPALTQRGQRDGRQIVQEIVGQDPIQGPLPLCFDQRHVLTVRLAHLGKGGSSPLG